MPIFGGKQKDNEKKTLEWRKKCKRYRSSRRFGYFYLANSLSCNKSMHTMNMTHCNLNYSWQIIRVLPNQQQNNDLVGHQPGKSRIEFVDLESMRKVIERNYKDVLKEEALEKERYDMQEPERHKRYLEIVKEKKLDAMKREVDTRINKMVKEEEEYGLKYSRNDHFNWHRCVMQKSESVTAYVALQTQKTAVEKGQAKAAAKAKRKNKQEDN